MKDLTKARWILILSLSLLLIAFILIYIHLDQEIPHNGLTGFNFVLMMFGAILFVLVSVAVFSLYKDFISSYRNEMELMKEVDKKTAELKETDETFRKVFEESADAVLLLKDEGFIDCNRSTLELLGYDTKYAVLSLQPWEISPERQPDGRLSTEKAREMIRIAYEKGNHKFDWVHTRSNGTDFPVEVMLTSISIKGEQYYYSVVRDLSERKMTEQKLRESETLFREITENSPSGIVLLGSDHRFRFISNSAKRIMGYRDEDIIGADPAKFTHPDDLGSLVVTLEDMLQTPGKVVQYTYRFMHANGSWRYVRSTFSNLLHIEGVEAISINFEDIHEAKLAEIKLNEVNERIHVLTKATQDAIWDWDLVNNSIWWNEGHYHLFGFDPSASVPSMEAFFKRLHPDDAAEIASNLDFINDPSKFNWSHETRFLRKDGSYGVAFQRCFATRDENGKATRLLGSFLDITELKQAELRLQKKLQDIEAIASLTESVSHANHLNDIYEVAMQTLIRTIGADKISILLFDEAGYLDFVASSGLSPEYKKHAAGHCPWKITDKNPPPILVSDASKDDSLTALLPVIEKEGIKALGFIPLIQKGRLIGKFMIYFTTVHEFTDEEVQLALTIARNVAFAIEEKKSEEALRISEQKYKVLFENNPMPLWMRSIDDLKLIDVNNAALKVYGYTKEEFLLVNLEDFHPVEELDFIRNEFSVELPEISNRGVWKQRRKDGTYMDVEVIAQDIMLNGKKVRIILSNDITEKLKAENDLKRSFEQIRELAAHIETIREEERKSIAREIHDELGQQLSGLKMEVAWLTRYNTLSHDQMEEKKRSVFDMLANTIATVRDLTNRLRPTMLDDLGLADTLDWQSRDFEKRTGIMCEIMVDIDQADLTAAMSTAIFRIYQECLTNITKYAQARHVVSKFTKLNNQLILTVADDGIGFDPEKVLSKKTLGLVGMKERALMLGGDCEVVSKEGNGTTVVVIIPILNNAR